MRLRFLYHFAVESIWITDTLLGQAISCSRGGYLVTIRFPKTPRDFTMKNASYPRAAIALSRMEYARSSSSARRIASRSGVSSRDAILAALNSEWVI